MSSISRSLTSPSQIIPYAHGTLRKQPQTQIPLESMRRWIKKVDWAKVAEHGPRSPVPPLFSYSTLRTLACGEGPFRAYVKPTMTPDGRSYEDYPYLIHKDHPAKVFTIDDDRKSIYIKFVFAFLSLPIYCLIDGAKSAYDATVGNVQKVSQNCFKEKPIILKEKKRSFWTPIFRLIRLPFFFVTMTVAYAAALVLAPLMTPFMPQAIFWWRLRLGMMETFFGSHERTECFIPVPMADKIQTYLEKAAVGKVAIAIPPTLFTENDPRFFLDRALTDFAYCRIREVQKTPADIPLGPMCPHDVLWSFLFGGTTPYQPKVETNPPITAP